MASGPELPPADQVAPFDRSVLYRAIIDSATDYAIIAADLAGRVIEWNVGAEAALGWPATAILGQSIATIFTPEDRLAGVPEAEMKLSLKTGHALDQRWHMRHDGSRFWADGRMMALTDPDGRALGYLKIVRDETSRKLSSTQATSATALRLITDHVDTAILQVDLAGSIVFVNPAAARLFGWSADDLNGRPLDTLLEPEAETIAAPDTSLTVQRETFVDRAMMLHVRGGEMRPVVCSQSPILIDGL